MADFLICGLEHTGTTLLSDLFRQIPDLESGFEVGVLLGKSPRFFSSIQPFYSNMLEGWKLTEEQLEDCCDTDSFDDFYSRLKKYSPLIDENVKSIFDKTPRYLAELDDVMTNIDVRILATYKDPRAIVFSDFKRSSAENFDVWMDSYVPGKHRYMSVAYKNYKKYRRSSTKVKFISLEAMSLNTHASLRDCFAFVGREFDLNYLLMKGQRYKNTKGRVVSAGVALSYREKLNKLQKKRIEIEFSDFDCWFYD